MNQIWENDKNPSFGLDFGPFDPNLQFLLFLSTALLTILPISLTYQGPPQTSKMERFIKIVNSSPS